MLDLESSADEKSSTDSLTGDIRRTLLAIKGVIGRYLTVPQLRLGIFQQMDVDREISQAEIQRNLKLDRAVLTRMVKQLEADGLLVRRPDPEDNRYNLIRLTAEGRRQYDELAAKVHLLDELLLAGLSQPETIALKSMLAQVLENAERIDETRKDDQNLTENETYPQI
jgi:DNA-binding MarR family transcriptional regulator